MVLILRAEEAGLTPKVGAKAAAGVMRRAATENFILLEFVSSFSKVVTVRTTRTTLTMSKLLFWVMETIVGRIRHFHTKRNERTHMCAWSELLGAGRFLLVAFGMNFSWVRVPNFRQAENLFVSGKTQENQKVVAESLVRQEDEKTLQIQIWYCVACWRHTVFCRW